MWTGLVEMKVWMRPRLAFLIASPQRSMSLAPARARPQTMLSVTISEIARTASKSPLEAIGKPASITSTFMSSRILESSSFSSRDIEAPGDCSPSRMVVSKMITCSDAGTAGAGSDTGSVMSVSRCSGRRGEGSGKPLVRPAAKDARA